MDTNKCPVCGNPGIPNYLNEAVVCPHCGSDLKIYRKVSELVEVQTQATDGTEKYKILSVVLPLIAIAATATVCLLSNPKQQETYYTQYIESKKLVDQLKDSVSVLNAQIQKNTSVPGDYVDYVVVKNDSPWGIVYKLYGSRSDWEKVAQTIAEDNGIWDDARKKWKEIHPGQVIRIKKIN